MLKDLQEILVNSTEVMSDPSRVFIGDPPSVTPLPYIVIRPIYISTDDRSLCGGAVGWNQQIGLYCVGASPEASARIALNVMRVIDGSYMSGSTLSTSLTYSGALVSGLYESLVNVSSTLSSLSL